jgi:hypothetical protein
VPISSPKLVTRNCVPVCQFEGLNMELASTNSFRFDWGRSLCSGS